MIQCYIFHVAKVCKPLRLSINLKDQIRASCIDQWDDNQFLNLGCPNVLKQEKFVFSLAKSDLENTGCKSVLWPKQGRFLKSLEEELLIVNRLERLTKEFQKNLKNIQFYCPTHPQMCSNKEHTKSKVCDSPGGHKERRHNYICRMKKLNTSLGVANQCS